MSLPVCDVKLKQYAPLMARVGRSLPLSSSPHAGGSAFEEMSAVGNSAAGTKSSGNVDHFGKFLLGYAGL